MSYKRTPTSEITSVVIPIQLQVKVLEDAKGEGRSFSAIVRRWLELKYQERNGSTLESMLIKTHQKPKNH